MSRISDFKKRPFIGKHCLECGNHMNYLTLTNSYICEWFDCNKLIQATENETLKEISEAKKIVKKLYNEGFSITEIQEKLDLSYYFVRGLMDTMGLANPRRFGDRRKEIIKLYKTNNYSISQIARKVECSRQYVSKVLKINGQEELAELIGLEMRKIEKV